MILGAARALFYPPGLRDQSKVKADATLASTLQRLYPYVWDSLVEAKVVAVTGCLPGGGGLDDQTGGLQGTLEWLAEAGILEWANRSPPSMGL